jgi:arginine exporter protein ArgO
MLEIGQWILLGIAVLLGVLLLCKAASYLIKFLFIAGMAVLAVYGLYHFSLLPESAKIVIDEIIAQDPVQRVQDWLHQRFYGQEPEKPVQEQEDTKS